MFLERLVLATGWSGNMDFMTANNSLPVDYELRDLRPGEYPEWQGQHWAEPNIDHAVCLAVTEIEDRTIYSSLTRQAKCSIIENIGNRAVGVRIGDRLEKVHEGGIK